MCWSYGSPLTLTPLTLLAIQSSTRQRSFVPTLNPQEAALIVLLLTVTGPVSQASGIPSPSVSQVEVVVQLLGSETPVVNVAVTVVVLPSGWRIPLNA